MQVQTKKGRIKGKKTDAEFDDYIRGYREVQDEHLHLSGESSDYFAEYKVRKMVEWLPELQNQKLKILDFGCGDGLMTEYIRRYFMYSKVFGADVSKHSVNEAKESFDGIEFSHIKDKTLDWPDQTFDLVVAAGVFHHVPEPEQKNWIDQAMRVLKTGGTFVVFELNPLNPGTQYIFRNHPMEKNAKMLFPWQTDSLLKDFDSVKVKFYCFFPKLFKFLRPLERFLTWLPVSALYACIARKH